jgi:hypothetical protein
MKKIDSVTSGIIGLKQIYKSLERKNLSQEEKDRIFEKHSAHFLNRVVPDWIKGHRRN